VFLDRWYLTPGQSWLKALEETLAQCRAVAVCIGQGEMGPWQQREQYLALERQVSAERRGQHFPVKSFHELLCSSYELSQNKTNVIS
jgi:hypothetical protein